MVSIEPVEPLVDRGPGSHEPRDGLVIGAGDEFEGTHAPGLVTGHETGRAEYVEVLQGRRQRHRAKASQLLDRDRPALQPLQHPPAQGIAQGAKDHVEWSFRILRHMPNYIQIMSQRNSRRWWAGFDSVTTAPDLTQLADERFVLLRTLRRSGEPVDTPVWVGRRGATLVVSTPEGTGKQKRLRHNANIGIQPCSRRGEPTPGTAMHSAQARVSREPALVQDVERILREKYRWEWRAAMLIERVVRRSRKQPRPVLLIS